MPAPLNFTDFFRFRRSRISRPEPMRTRKGGARCVGDADNPIVTMHLPKAEASAASAAADTLLALHPQASIEIKRDTLRALRLAAKDALPTVKPAILAAPPFGPPKRAPPAAVMAEELTSLPGTSGGVVAIGLFLEQCGTTSTRDEFEAMSQAAIAKARALQTRRL